MSGKRNKVGNSASETSWMMELCPDCLGEEPGLADETVHLDNDQADTKWGFENFKAKRVNRWRRRKHRSKTEDFE